MSIDKNMVHKVARLARLRLEDNEDDKRTDELNTILGLIEELQAVNTDGVDPMTSVINMPPPLRDDQVNDGQRADDILLNAPEDAADFFVVDKVVE